MRRARRDGGAHAADMLAALVWNIAIPIEAFSA